MSADIEQADIKSAQVAIKEGVYNLLTHFNINPNQLLQVTGIRVEISFTGRSGEFIPQELRDFTSAQYPNRQVEIDQIEIGYGEVFKPRKFGRIQKLLTTGFIHLKSAHVYPTTPESAANEKRRVLLEKDEITGTPVSESISLIERQSGASHFILPETERVVVDTIHLIPFAEIPTAGIAFYPLKEWLEAYKATFSETAREHLQRQLSVVSRVTDPYKLGLGTVRTFVPPYDHKDILEIPFDPNVVRLVASLIPYPQTRQTFKSDFLGIDIPKPEPSRRIIIH